MSRIPAGLRTPDVVDDPSSRTESFMRATPLRAAPLSTFLALVFSAIAVLAPDGVSQEASGYDVQLPEGEGTYPTGDLFIRGLDSVWTAAGEVVAGGSILIREGTIEAVGADLTVPEGVDVLDGSGLTAIPGIVDEHSHTAMTGGGNEGTGAVVPEVRVLDALDPTAFGIYRALSGGVTTARIMHGSSNPIGGQSAVIKMRWGMERSDQLLVPGAPRFVKFALGENVTRKNFRLPGRPVRFPASRSGVETIYVEAFTAAREYRDAWAAYDENPDDFRVPPRRDLRLEALVDIMEGRIRVHAHSYRSDEILMLMRVAERFGFRIDVFTHILEGYKVAAEMAEHGAAGATFSDWWQYKLEAYDAIPYNAAVMHDSGVLTAINSDIPWLQSFMIHEIPKPVKYGGVSREDALRMLTLHPARMMHIDDKVGSLEAGKQGDVVLLNASPFDAYARVEKTIVDGVVYYDLSDEEGTRDEPFHEMPALDPGAPVADASAVTVPPDVEEAEGDPTPDLQVGSFALVGGTVHPVSRPPVEDGVVVVRNGRITAVGSSAQVQVPGDVRVVDVSDRHVYPGMIDPVTILGLFEFGQSGNASDTEETGRYNPHVRAIAGTHMHSAAIPVARANGVTAAMVAQRSGVIQGTAGVIQLRGDTWERAAVEEEAALVVDFPAPRAPTSDAGWTVFAARHDELEAGGPLTGFGASAFTAREPTDFAPVTASAYLQSAEDEPEPTLDGERMEELVDLFRRARLYARSPTTRDDPTAPFWPNRASGDEVILEALVPAVTGALPVLFRADTDWQIRTLFAFLDEFPEVDAVVVGGARAFRVADELAEREVPVILTSAYSPTPDRDDSITASYRNAALLHRAGVTVAFGTDTSADVRNLPYHAAHSVAFGLPRDEGLRAVTLNPARILGVDDATGSLDAGKRADILVTNGDPLQYLTDVERMWIGGAEVSPDDNKHHRLYTEFRDRR